MGSRFQLCNLTFCKAHGEDRSPLPLLIVLIERQVGGSLQSRSANLEIRAEIFGLAICFVDWRTADDR